MALRARRHSHNPKPTLLTFIAHYSTSTKRKPTFSAVVGDRCKSGFTKLEDAHQLFEQMLGRKPPLSIIRYNQLLGAVAKMGLHSTVISLYKRMTAMLRDIKPDLCTFSILINSLGKLNQMRLGFSVLGLILRSGYAPDKVTLGALVNGLCVSGEIDDAMELFRKCQEKMGTSFDAAGYGVIINGLCKNGKLDTAVEMLRDMDDGKKKAVVSPHALIYGYLIHAMCSAGRWEDGKGYFDEMLARGMAPDLFVYSVLINALCKEGKLEEAEEMLGVMISRGIQPNVITFNSLIRGYCSSGRMDGAVKVFNIMMVNNDVELDIVTYNTLIDGFCKTRNSDEAVRLFSEMQIRGNISVVDDSVLDELRTNRLGVAVQLFREVEKNTKLQPNIVTYAVLIAGMLRHRQLKNAREFFNLIPTKGLEPNVITYNIMLDGFCKQGTMEEAEELFAGMKEKGCVSEISFGSLIHGYCLRGRMEDAVKTFNVMVTEGCEPGLVTYTTLIEGFCMIGNPDEATRLFSMMQIHGKSQDVADLRENRFGVPMQLLRVVEDKQLRPCLVTYNVLLAGMLKHGQLDNAREFFDLIPAKGLKPNVITYTIMIYGLCKEGMMEEAKELFVQMEAKGCTPDETAYRALLEGYLQRKDDVKAMELMQEMIGRGFSPKESTVPKSISNVLDSG